VSQTNTSLNKAVRQTRKWLWAKQAGVYIEDSPEARQAFLANGIAISKPWPPTGDIAWDTQPPTGHASLVSLGDPLLRPNWTMIKIRKWQDTKT
jgi:hypothetical protein